jgi:hypothetical protein
LIRNSSCKFSPKPGSSGRYKFPSRISRSMSLMSTPNTVIWANYFGRAYLGSIRGFVFTIMVAFSTMGALPFGFIYDRTGSYNDAGFVLLILPVIAYMLALEPKAKLNANRY